MKVLLFGASGMLGFAVHRVLHDSGYRVLGVLRAHGPPASDWCEGLDYVCNVDAESFDTVIAAIEKSQPDVVVNAAGVTLAGPSSTDAQRLYAVNSRFPRLLGLVTGALGVHLIHFSSDGVFSGARGMYTERSLPDASDPYGTSKLLGEPDPAKAMVLRTSVIGRGIQPNSSLLDWFLRQTGTVRGFARAVFSGLPVNEIANVLASRILTRSAPLTGLFNLAARPIDKLSLLELARVQWSMQQRVRLERDDSLVIDRSLDAHLLQTTLGYVPDAWEQLMIRMHTFYRTLERRTGS